MASYRIINRDGLCVAQIDGPLLEATTELQHYLYMYADEGPLRAEVRKGRKWVDLSAPQGRVAT